MKKLLLGCIVAAQLIMSGTAVFAAESVKPAHEKPPYKEDPWGFRWDMKVLALDKAVEDINANRRFIVAVRDEFGESRLLEWGIPVAARLPDQPVAVIKIMAELDIPVRDMCPRIVIEDAIPFYEYVRWMESAVASLESFTMLDPKEEAVRADCLGEIKESLAKKESWRY